MPTAGLITAVSLAALFLFAGLWSPVTAIPAGLVFLIVAIGIFRRRRWSAYGGALLLAALAAVVVIGLLRASAPNVAKSVALVTGFFGIATVFLCRAARAMPPGGWPAPWITLATLVFLLPQIYRPYLVGAASMENTILVGDHILVRPFVGTPERGDILQLRNPTDPRQLLFKRIVAVGGDRVRIVHKALVINGRPVSEPYAIFKTDAIEDFRDNFPADPPLTLPNLEWAEWLKRNISGHEIVVPDGKFFVLGDNRDSSLDSRYFGFVELQGLVGKPVLIYFSVDAPRNSSEPVLLHSNWIRWNRIFQRL